MRGQAGFFDLDERLQALSAKGDALERLGTVVDFELFRRDLARAVPRSDGAKGGRPAFDLVLMVKVLVIQASHSLSDERTEFLIKDRLSFMRFLGLGLADAVPDANTIWTFREALARAPLDGRPAIQVLFAAYEAALTKAGFLAKVFKDGADRSSTRRWWRRLGSATARARRPTSRRGASRKAGRTSLRSSPGRTATRAGG